jgi:hypothetical protein
MRSSKVEVQGTELLVKPTHSTPQHINKERSTAENIKRRMKSASAPAPSPSKLSSQAILELIARDKSTGVITENDLFEAIYICGFEPSFSEIDEILKDDEIDPVKVTELFSNTYSVKFEHLRYNLFYWRLNRRVLRENDDYSFFPQSFYVAYRMVNLMTPLLPYFQTYLFIPNQSPRERSIFKLTRAFGSVVGLFTSFYWAVVVIAAFGLLDTVETSEIATISAFALILIGSQAAREGFSWSVQGDR